MDLRIKTERQLAQWLWEQVSERRYRHSLGVMEAVTQLALAYRFDPYPLRLAALLHDALRELPDDRLLGLADEWLLTVREPDRQAPVLLHGRLAVELAEREFGLSDPVMVSAMRHHTAGHRQMSLPDKLFFLADHIEPGRTHPAVKELRQLAFEDVDAAMLSAIESSQLYLSAAGAVIDPDTLKLKESLLAAGAGNAGTDPQA